MRMRKKLLSRNSEFLPFISFAAILAIASGGCAKTGTAESPADKPLPPIAQKKGDGQGTQEKSDPADLPQIEAAGKKTMTFAVDSSTKILKQGATTKTKERKEAGAKGLTITDVVKSGDQVTVRYMMTGTTMHAMEVRGAPK